MNAKQEGVEGEEEDVNAKEREPAVKVEEKDSSALAAANEANCREWCRRRSEKAASLQAIAKEEEEGIAKRVQMEVGDWERSTEKEPNKDVVATMAGPEKTDSDAAALIQKNYRQSMADSAGSPAPAPFAPATEDKEAAAGEEDNRPPPRRPPPSAET